MSDPVRELVFDEKSEQEEELLISLDIEDDKLFLLHFIIGTYFGPDLINNKNKNKNQSAFQIQASSNPPPTKDDLTGSLMKRAELERVYYHILRNADPSLVFNRKVLSRYFNEKHNKASHEDSPLFRDLFPSKLHPESRLRNQYKLIKSIVLVNDPDTSCMREECVERFKLLTGLQSFALSLNVDVTEPVEANEDGTSVEAKPAASVVNGATGEAQGGQVVGLMDIGECADAYLFRVSLPGVKRDERYFSCEVEENGKVLVRGVTTTGEKQVHRYSQVFKMKTQNLCPPGDFSVSFNLPGPVCPQEFNGSFGTDAIFEGIVMKKLQKEVA